MPKVRFLFKPLAEALKQQQRENKSGFKRFHFAGKRRKPEGGYETVTFIHVNLTKIKSFGFVHDLELTQKGTPRQFNRWGYISLNSGAYYRVSIVTVRELQERLGTRCQIDRKEVQTAIRNRKNISAIDWHMSIIPDGTVDDSETDNK